MEGFLGTWHPAFKALHILAAIFWMAGMLYLPRLFVYHAASASGSPQSQTFKVMERRLLKGIINPAMVAAFALGIALMLDAGPALWAQGWWHAKLAAALAMAGAHGFLSRCRRAFAEDRNGYSPRFFRLINEVPTVLLVVVVVMVVVRPF